MSKTINKIPDTESSTSNRFFSPRMISSIATLAIGGYLIYRNRERLQQIVEDSGIMERIGRGSQSGAAKSTSSIKRDMDYQTAV